MCTAFVFCTWNADDNELLVSPVSNRLPPQTSKLGKKAHAPDELSIWLLRHALEELGCYFVIVGAGAGLLPVPTWRFTVSVGEVSVAGVGILTIKDASSVVVVIATIAIIGAVGDSY